ncbi:hypothetical protein MPSEU_000847600 [Mayamaea pseudoterrestris]|nr:hypothetical protein MPSEU_000847600 [Mayamaea pseudoterrestris]
MARTLVALTLLLASWSCLHILQTFQNLEATSLNRRLRLRNAAALLGLPEAHHQHDLPSFSLRIKVSNAHENLDKDLHWKQVQQELEAVVSKHLLGVIQEDLDLQINLHSDKLTILHADDETVIIEANFTGSVTLSADMLTQYSPARLFVLVKRALVTKEEYTRLVERLHAAPGLPVVRGVKVTLHASTAEKIRVHDEIDNQLLRGDETMRLVAFMSMGALLAIVLCFIEMYTRPKRKNWKVKKSYRRSLFRSIKKILSLRFPTAANASNRPPAMRRPTDSSNATTRRRSRSYDRDVLFDPLIANSKSFSAGRMAHSHHERTVPTRSMSSRMNNERNMQRDKMLVARSNSFNPSVARGPMRTNTPRRGRRRMVEGSPPSLLIASGDGTA